MNQQANSAASKITLTVSALLTAIALVALLIALQMRPRSAPATGVLPDSAPAANGPVGAYSGIVELDWALAGVYSDTLPTPTPQPAVTPGTPSPIPILSAIDLGLLFHPGGNQGDGHVDLSSTLMFTKEHTIMATPIGPTPGPGTPPPAAVALAVGPKVSVTLNGANLRVESERFAMTTSAGQRLQRQFRLIGVAADGDIHRFTGDYRETIWGFGRQPLTLVGKFTIVQPVVATPTSVATSTPTAVATNTPTRTPTAAPAGFKIFLPLNLRQH